MARHLQQLPGDWKADIAATLFGGRTRRLISLAERQRRSGEYVDDDGVMALATANYLGRNIVVYGFHVSLKCCVNLETKTSVNLVREKFKIHS